MNDKIEILWDRSEKLQTPSLLNSLTICFVLNTGAVKIGGNSVFVSFFFASVKKSKHSSISSCILSD